MTELDILIEARRWLSVRTHWCKQALWRDAFGDTITGLTAAGSKVVASTCAMGAVYYVNALAASDMFVSHAKREVTLANVRLGIAARALGHPNLAHLNDHGTYAQVLEMFDLAISMAQQEEISGGLPAPSVPLQVPAPYEEPRETPVYPSTVDPGPIESPVETPVEAPVETPQHEPVPA